MSKILTPPISLRIQSNEWSYSSTIEEGKEDKKKPDFNESEGDALKYLDDKVLSEMFEPAEYLKETCQRLMKKPLRKKRSLKPKPKCKKQNRFI